MKLMHILLWMFIFYIACLLAAVCGNLPWEEKQGHALGKGTCKVKRYVVVHVYFFMEQ